MNTLELVKEWHQKFKAPVNDTPCPEAHGRSQLRLDLLQEELNELKEGVEGKDIVEIFDALLDIQYVLDGAFLEFGLHSIKETGFSEVQASNMSKLGEDGQPILREDGKILKGPNFFRPDLAQIVSQYQGRQAS